MTYFLILAAALCCIGTVLGLADKTLTVTTALPNGAASVNGTGIDLESTTGEFLADVEFECSSPALTVAQMVNADTLTFIVETCAEPTFAAPTTFISSLFVQTGAGGVGCAAAVRRFRLPTTTLRYVRIKATKTGTGNATTANMTFRLLQLS